MIVVAARKNRVGAARIARCNRRGLALDRDRVGDEDVARAGCGELCDLCRRFPGFERYARLMEEVSEQNQAMMAAGAHPYGDLPQLPEPLKASLLHVLRGAAELESEFQAAVDDRREDQAERLTAMRRQWADDLRKLVLEFRCSGLPLRTQALVQQAVKAVAERIERMQHE